ncbi:hypothetical protein VTK73DRAFT_9047 [Phialemonium thermophilum]|uniref:Fungal lipase-type domain-containing protein n=1 Tax=Phialemonium thermophilum TaxID=223376 RepID=A0ABR3XLM6_9PEZI
MNFANLETSELAGLKFFAQYAGAAYCNSENTAGQLIVCSDNVCPDVQASKAKTVVSLRGPASDITGFVAADLVNSLIVVLEFNLVPHNICGGCQVHSGFLRAWDEVSAAVQAGVATARATHPSFAVVATGHSLGAAIATLAVSSMRTPAAGAVPIDLYTYGSPRVGNAAFATFVASQNSTGSIRGAGYRVTHLADPVPRLPPLCFGFQHLSPEYWLATGTATTTDYDVADVVVCDGPACRSCNAGTDGLDVMAHMFYFESISGCVEVQLEPSASLEGSRASSGGANVAADELMERLQRYTEMDEAYVVRLEGSPEVEC